MCHRGHYKALSRGWLVGGCGRPRENVFLFAYNVCTLDTVTSHIAVKSVLITIRSMRDANKFHFFHFFETLFGIITVSFTIVFKTSPAGESCSGWSTWKSICAVPAWTLTSENSNFGVCASRCLHQLTSHPKRCLLFWKVVVWEQFWCLHFIWPRRPAGPHRHQRLLLLNVHVLTSTHVLKNVSVKRTQPKPFPCSYLDQCIN